MINYIFIMARYNLTSFHGESKVVGVPGDSITGYKFRGAFVFPLPLRVYYTNSQSVRYRGREEGVELAARAGVVASAISRLLIYYYYANR